MRTSTDWRSERHRYLTFAVVAELKSASSTLSVVRGFVLTLRLVYLPAFRLLRDSRVRSIKIILHDRSPYLNVIPAQFPITCRIFALTSNRASALP